MTVDDVLAVAKTTLIEFGEQEFVADEELYRELAAEDVRTIAAIARVNNFAYPMNDLCAQVDNFSTVRGPLALAPLGDVWIIRRMEVEYGDGFTRPVHSVAPAHKGVMPALVPASCRERDTIHLLDGLGDSQSLSLAQRRWGWEGVEVFRIYYLEHPGAGVMILSTPSGSDTLGSPDDALMYLARFVAAKLAIRAKLEEVPLKVLQGKVDSARKELLAHVEAYGTADA